jgi:hypothetical protein
LAHPAGADLDAVRLDARLEAGLPAEQGLELLGRGEVAGLAVGEG